MLHFYNNNNIIMLLNQKRIKNNQMIKYNNYYINKINCNNNNKHLIKIKFIHYIRKMTFRLINNWH